MRLRLNRKGIDTMLRAASEGGWVQVKAWLFGLLAFIATLGTILTGLLSFALTPLKKECLENTHQRIVLSERQQILEQRMEEAETLASTLGKLGNDIDWIKREITILRGGKVGNN